MTGSAAPARPAPTPASISQSTAVEQSRAVAEVQAAIFVAQQFPRDVERAFSDMQQACSRLRLAERAFYDVTNRGRGPSVHLARELVRIWGNVDAGVRELRRDDAAGESEVQAFAWDQQTNVRQTRTFIVPHAKMVGRGADKKRVPLIDLNDIYLSNQNTGARAVRECIFAVLPVEFVEAAQDVCKLTIEKGDGTPLVDRIAKSVAAFEGLGVKLAQLEKRVGRKRGQWNAGDVAALGVTYGTITRDGVAPSEFFPADERVEAADVRRQNAAAAELEAEAAKGPLPPAGEPHLSYPPAEAARVAAEAAAAPPGAQDEDEHPGMDDADRQAQEEFERAQAAGGIDLTPPEDGKLL